MKFILYVIFFTNLILGDNNTSDISKSRDMYNDEIIEIVYKIMNDNNQLDKFKEDISLEFKAIKNKKLKEIFTDAYTLEFISRFEIEPEEDYLEVNPKLDKYKKVIENSKRRETILFYMYKLYSDNNERRKIGELFTSGYVLDYIKRKIKKLNN